VSSRTSGMSSGQWSGLSAASNSARWSPLCTPAPGAYDEGISRDDLGIKSHRSHNSQAASGNGQFGSLSTRDDLDVISFNASNEGDPGMYHPGGADAEFLYTRAKRTHNAEGRKGNAKFNALSDKGDGIDHGGKPRSEMLFSVGPQEYDFYHLFGCAQSDAKFAPVTAMRSAFTSALPLGGHVRKTFTPGVGDHDPEAAAGHLRRVSNYSTRGSSMFADDMGQHPLNEETMPPTTGEGVGPGKYEASPGMRDRSLAKRNPRLPPFASSNRRSGPTDWAGVCQC